MFTLGVQAEQGGEIERAIEWYQRAVAADLHNVATFNLGAIAGPLRGHRGAIAGRQGDMGESIRWWTMAVEHGHLNAIANVAKLAVQDGDFAEAKKWLRVVTDLGDPSALDALANIANPAWQRARGMPS